MFDGADIRFSHPDHNQHSKGSPVFEALSEIITTAIIESNANVTLSLGCKPLDHPISYQVVVL
jgi:hypothetical protein